MASLAFRLGSLEDDDPWIVEQETFNILEEYLQSTVKPAPKRLPIALATSLR